MLFVRLRREKNIWCLRLCSYGETIAAYYDEENPFLSKTPAIILRSVAKFEPREDSEFDFDVSSTFPEYLPRMRQFFLDGVRTEIFAKRWNQIGYSHCSNLHREEKVVDPT